MPNRCCVDLRGCLILKGSVPTARPVLMGKEEKRITVRQDSLKLINNNRQIKLQMKAWGVQVNAHKLGHTYLCRDCEIANKYCTLGDRRMHAERHFRGLGLFGEFFSFLSLSISLSSLFSFSLSV